MQNDKRRIRLWIPLIVLWPVVVVAVLLGTPVAYHYSLSNLPESDFRPRLERSL